MGWSKIQSEPESDLSLTAKAQPDLTWHITTKIYVIITTKMVFHVTHFTVIWATTDVDQKVVSILKFDEIPFRSFTMVLWRTAVKDQKAVKILKFN